MSIRRGSEIGKRDKQDEKQETTGIYDFLNLVVSQEITAMR
jgi:hypothetical protein